jgi:hypothetical protein
MTKKDNQGNEKNNKEEINKKDGKDGVHQL